MSNKNYVNVNLTKFYIDIILYFFIIRSLDCMLKLVPINYGAITTEPSFHYNLIQVSLLVFTITIMYILIDILRFFYFIIFLLRNSLKF